MQPDDEPTVDVEIVASAAADELRFHSVPDVQVSFPGIGARESRRITARRNIDTPVQPGKAYHRVVATTWINTGWWTAPARQGDSRRRPSPAGQMTIADDFVLW